MNASSSLASRRNRSLARVGLAAAAAFLALAGCAGPDVQVTVTVPAAGASPHASAAASPAAPAKPGTPAKPTTAAKPSTPAKPAPAVPDTGAPSVVVTQGAIADQCTHTVCHYVHVSWKNLKPGVHDTQCVTDHGTTAMWSQSTYNYATADGERDLGCFLGYPGSHVWVILDGTLESVHAAWG